MIKTFRPDQPGAKGHFRLHGDRLICVRYRVDEARLRRYTTIELIVDDQPLPDSRRRREPLLVSLRVEWDEPDLAHLLRLHGARYDHELRLWQLPRPIVRRLGLTRRIVPSPRSA